MADSSGDGGWRPVDDRQQTLQGWALEITKAWTGDASNLFSKSIPTEMLTVQKAPYGLGVELAGTAQSLEFSHGGSNSGFRALVVMFPAVGKGAVIMANGDRADFSLVGLDVSFTLDTSGRATSLKMGEIMGIRKP
jgi:hypothetical protein